MKKIQEYYEGDRPREKLLNKGVKALKEYELMAVLLGSGTKDKDVIQLSKEIMKILEEGVDGLSLTSLMSVHGLGQAKAMQILSAIELSCRLLMTQESKITSSDDVYQLLKSYGSKQQEYFLVMTLDGANRVINTREVFIGTLNHTLVHPREVFADAITDRAASIIISHNHPSGELIPSEEDIKITKALKEAAILLGIELIDHIIISKNGYFSFRDDGLIDG